MSFFRGEDYDDVAQRERWDRALAWRRRAKPKLDVAVDALMDTVGEMEHEPISAEEVEVRKLLVAAVECRARLAGAICVVEDRIAIGRE